MSLRSKGERRSGWQYGGGPSGRLYTLSVVFCLALTPFIRLFSLHLRTEAEGRTREKHWCTTSWDRLG